MTIKERIITTLKEAVVGLNQLQDNYCIIGSSALILSGAPIEITEDLDILVSNRDADLLKKIWNDKNLHLPPKPSDLFRSNLSRYRFAELDVEIIGELEVNKEGSWLPLKVFDYQEYTIGGTSVNIPTLEEQQKILRFFGRDKDMERLIMLNEMISNNH